MNRTVLFPAIAIAAGLALPLAARVHADDAAAGSGSASSGSASASSAAPPGSASAPASAPASASASAKGPAKKPSEDDPLVIPEGVKPVIGSNVSPEDNRPSGAVSRTGLFPLAYKQRIGNEITSAIFPFYYERRAFDDAQKLVDRESFYGLYYRRRSARFDVDAAFPLFLRWRDDQTTTTVVPPVLWRDGPNGEWHRWLAPLFFASSQPDGGYLHIPALLTFSHHNPKSAFSLIGGLGFYDRTGKDVDWGLVPLVFGGNNSEKLTSYFLIPPLLTYHSENKDAGASTTWVGPVLYKSSPKKTVFDLFPLLFHNHGIAEGEGYTSTTLLPLFHYSRSATKSLIVTPVFGSAKDDEGETTITPFYSRYRGRTRLDLAGPIIPLFAHYVDPDAYRESYLFGPVYTSSDPTRFSVITPLFAHFAERGVGRTTWVFPTFTHTTDKDGWSFNLHPLVYTAKSGDTWHDVVAPIWWDFGSAKKRSTVLFPVFWRFRDEEGTTQVALNTVWIDRKSSRGANWDFYFLPVFHVGDSPNGSAWDFLFGFVGYKREGTYKQLKLLWIPIDLTKPPPTSTGAPAK